MKIILSPRKHQYVAIVSIFLIMLIMVALIGGMAGCQSGVGNTATSSQNLEIRTWYDLDGVMNNLAGKHALMNDLESATLGYEELASPTTNRGKGCVVRSLDQEM